MTAKEAIRILKEYVMEEGNIDFVYEALEMALSALEAQESSQNVPNGDFISRKAAIDAADRADYTGLAVEDVKKVTDEVVKELKQLPSAQPDTKAQLSRKGTTSDLISRAAAMTEIQMIAERYTLAHEKMSEGHVEWSEYLVRMSDALDVIRDLQSVKPYQEESV